MRIVQGLRIELESALRQQANVDLGRALVEDGSVQFRGFPPVQIAFWKDWTADPHLHRTWVWNTTSFNFMPWLLAYHFVSGRDAALDLAFECADSWFAALNELEAKKFEFAWHDHGTALRAQHILWLWSYVTARRLRREQRDRLIGYLEMLGERLFQEEFFSKHTNHGIDQAKVVLLIALSFPELAGSQAKREISVRRLIEELRFSFAEDGVHAENSPGYHISVCRIFSRISSYLVGEGEEKLREEIRRVMAEAIKFATHILRPDGCLPVIGDTEGVPTTDPYIGMEDTEVSKHFQYAMTQGKRGDAPPERQATFSESGWFCARDSWSSTKLHLIFRAGCRSPYHRHEDDLSIVLWAWGEDWFVDGGLYHYKESEAERQYIRSLAAHNVPLLMKTGDYQSLVRAPTVREGRFSRHFAGGDVSSITGWVAADFGAVIQRTVEVDMVGQSISTFDALAHVDRLPERVRLCCLWHVPDDKGIRLEESSVEIEGQSHVLVGLLPKKSRVMVVDGEKLGGISPFYSRRMNAKAPARLLSVEAADGARDLDVVWRFRAKRQSTVR